MDVIGTPRRGMTDSQRYKMQRELKQFLIDNEVPPRINGHEYQKDRLKRQAMENEFGARLVRRTNGRQRRIYLPLFVKLWSDSD